MPAPATVPSTADRPRAGDDAAARCERLLALAAVASRLGALPMLVVAVALAPAARLAPLLGLAVVATAQTLAYAVAGGRRGVITARWAVLDTATTAVVVWAGEWLANEGGAVERSHAYNYATISAMAVGLARWPAWSALLAGGCLATATVVNSLTGHLSANWNALPDAITPVGVVTVAAVVAGLLRRAARKLDEYRGQAVRSAAALAAERERVRQADQLNGPLLSTLDELVARDAVAQPAMAGQLRSELAWLRDVVASGLVTAPTQLDAGLRQVVAAKSAAGMALRLELPQSGPTLDPTRVEALVEATREALTNVVKHAGTMAATVTVSRTGGGVLVEVTDAGRGYDPATVAPGVGLGSSIQRRVAETGGHVEVTSAPGQGTRVRLWTPLW
ncbi:ATP-binding protein [Micromonosporaceae bacterium B7E4]